MFKQNVYVCHSERCAKERSDQARVEEPRGFFFYSYCIREFSQRHTSCWLLLPALQLPFFGDRGNAQRPSACSWNPNLLNLPTHPRSFSSFCCKQSTYLESTLGPLLRHAWVTLGPRLGHPRATQSLTQSQPSRQRVAFRFWLNAEC